VSADTPPGFDDAPLLPAADPHVQAGRREAAALTSANVRGALRNIDVSVDAAGNGQFAGATAAATVAQAYATLEVAAQLDRLARILADGLGTPR
jgi:hypothetical protein